MANTEGMPDEFVESLAMASTTTTTSSSSRRSRLQERLDMPMGEKPAAKVVRKSRPMEIKSSSTKSSKKSQQAFEEEELKSSEESSSPAAEPPALALVGNVMERGAPNAAAVKSQAGKKKSRFAQQQEQMKQSKQGFPSVHMPLGTFLKPKQATAATKTTSPLTSSSSQTVSNPPSFSSTAVSKNNNDSSILQASQQEAANMLSGMSKEEIREAQQELTASLSPEMRAFLQARGKAKTTQKRQQNNISKSETTSRVQSPQHPPKAATTFSRSAYASSTEEKERLATLVSSVQTHDDLDKLYEKELQQEHPLVGDKDGDLTGENNFQMACDLLRSSVPRQTLWAAKHVRDHLQECAIAQSKSTTTKTDRNWPTVLPVSLRCLLDQPSGANGYILHTYVLQSLQYLIQLELPHLSSGDTLVHQLYFMEDAVPTTQSVFPSVEVKPLTVQETGTSKPVAYATSSSSTSAQTDAEAFEKDPLWTLLSKMRLLPRLAQLLEQSSVLPQEFVAASCKILQCLCQRSPGAASAIAQHPTIVQALKKATILEDRHLDNADLAKTTIEFLCTLARQSRVAAESLKVQEWLPQILGVPASSELHFQLQRLTVVLWRTCLRYGLALQCTSDILQLAAAKHLALPFSAQFSLSTDFLSAFSQVLECVYNAQSKPEEKARTQISEIQWQFVSQAASWLSLTRRNVWPSSSASPMEVDDMSSPHELKASLAWNAARLRFLGTFLQVSSALQQNSSTKSEFKADEVSMEDELTLLETIDRWLDTDGFVDAAFSVLAQAGVSTVFIRHDNKTDYELEAVSSAFLVSLFNLILIIEKDLSTAGNAMVRSLSTSVVKRCVLMSLRLIHNIAEHSPKASADTSNKASMRQNWINQCHFSIAKLLAHAESLDMMASSTNRSLIRLLVFALIGRLEKGQEAIAAVLFSMDKIFQPNTNPLEEDMDSASPISSLFLGELCSSQSARHQLDHSFKLQHGFGLTSEEFGPFMLDSLLSNADSMGPGAAQLETILPIGRYWLWKTLSGSIQTSAKPVSHGFTEGANVVTASLNLLLEIEQQEEISDLECYGYASRIPLGAKLYYLTNVCLHHEDILRNDRVLESAESLLDLMFKQLHKSSIQSFGNACLQHTSPARVYSAAEEEEKLDEKDEKLLKMFNPEPIEYMSLSSEELKSLDAFIEDLLSAFSDYGAQYNFFIKCMRLFLMSPFPTSIRCKAIKELTGVLHLLTLPGEVEDTSSSGIRLLLSKGLVGGLPKNDMSVRDSADLLNLVASLAKPGGATRPPEGFLLLLTIALLARNLAICISDDDSAGLEAFKKRIMAVDAAIVDRIFEVALLFSKSEGNVIDLVDATLEEANIEYSGTIKTQAEIDSDVRELKEKF